FVMSQALSTLFSIDFHTSLFGYYGRFNGGLVSILAYVILFFVFLYFAKRSTVISLLSTSLIVSAVTVLWGIPGKLGADLSCLLFVGDLSNKCWTDQFDPAARMFSTLGQPNWLGAYLVVNFFIGIFFLIRQILQKRKNYSLISFYSFYLLINVSGVLFTRSRSAIAALFIGFLIMPIFFLISQQRKQFKPFIARYLLILVMIMVPVIIFKTGIDKVDSLFSLTTYFKAKPAVIHTIKTPVNSTYKVTESLDIRKVVWQGAIELGERHPLFGTGVETFAYVYYQVRPATHNLTSEWDYLYNKAHNEYLNYYATTGIIGISTYLLLIGGTLFLGLRLLAKSTEVEDIALVASLLTAYITILITNFFGFSVTIINLFFYLIPAFMLVISTVKDAPEELRKKKTRYGNYFGYAVFVGMGLYALVWICQYFYADTLYAYADLASKSSEYQIAAQKLYDALKIHYEHVYEDKLSYTLASLSYVAVSQKENSTAGQLIKLAQYYNQKSVAASPSNILYYKTTAKDNYLFYQTTGDISYVKQGIIALDKAIELGPTEVKSLYSRGVMYSVLNDEEKDSAAKKSYQKRSLSDIDAAIRLKDDYEDAWVMKGQLLKRYGEKTQAKAIYEQIVIKFGTNNEVKKELEAL
ncbi:hypothetical protein HGB07_02125, partial [Candidatus Roizmanbacteria bacterium]|nr:hypothetical protein [Candidatus Roizmanbacteria bacterium]